MAWQMRRDTAANWTSENPVLAEGEPGLDTTNDVLKIGDGTTAWNALSSYRGQGALLAALSWTGSGTSLFSTTSTSYVDLDATNAKVDFTVPASGKVKVQQTAYCYTTTSGEYVGFNLREGASDVSGAGGLVMRNNGHEGVRTLDQIVTGLTPGAAKTWKFGFKSNGGGNCHIRVGSGVYAPVAMAVWEAP